MRFTLLLKKKVRLELLFTDEELANIVTGSDLASRVEALKRRVNYK